MPKMLSPNTTIYWIAADAIAKEDDLYKASTYTAGGGGTAKAVNISCAITTDMTLNATDSDTDDSRSICDSGNAKTPTVANYEASLTFFREAIASGQKAAGNTTVYDKAFQLFKRGTQDGLVEGYLVKRIGFKQDAPMEADMEISVYKVVADNPRDELGDGDKPIQFTVPFQPQGYMQTYRKVAA
nr:MAG TPA: major tail protein [Caudoviricetes sp.]